MAWDIAAELIERLGDKLEVGGANIPEPETENTGEGDQQ